VVSKVDPGISVLGGDGHAPSGRGSFGGWKTMLRHTTGRHRVTTDYLKISGVCISMTRNMGRGKCLLQQFSELLWSNGAVQPDDRGGGWTSSASVCDAVRRSMCCFTTVHRNLSSICLSCVRSRKLRDICTKFRCPYRKSG